MVTTRIDLANLSAQESELLVYLFEEIKYTDVFLKDVEYTFVREDESTKELNVYSLTLSNDVVRRVRNKDPNAYRYEVVANKDKVGQGGFSQVFSVLCTLAIDNHQLVIKKNKNRVVKVQKYSRDELNLLYAEVDLTQRAKNMHMKHPAIVRDFENYEYTGYLVMRRLNGTDLYDVIMQLYANALDLSVAQRLTYIIKLLAQLKNLHAKGIIHRDLKPENVMVDLNTGELEIFDYGLSKLATTNDAGILLGTKGYIPPEVYAEIGTNAKSDVFSIAVVIAMMWYANEPGEEPEDVLDYQFDNIFKDDKLDLTDTEKEAILTTLKNMTKKERDARYTTDEALQKFIQIREDYVNRKIDEWAANKPKLYELKDGLFYNVKSTKPEAPKRQPLHSCRF